jgi:hypothetical protein
MYGVSFFSSSVQELGRLTLANIFNSESAMNLPHQYIDLCMDYFL